MSTLAQRLDAIRASSAEKIPAAAQAVMHHRTEELIGSGQAGRALGAGDLLPAYALPDSTGAIHSLAQGLNGGPLVLTFFRGHW